MMSNELVCGREKNRYIIVNEAINRGNYTNYEYKVTGKDKIYKMSFPNTWYSHTRATKHKEY